MSGHDSRPTPEENRRPVQSQSGARVGRAPKLRQLLSVTRAAEVLACSRDHVYDLIDRGHLSTVDIRATAAGVPTRSKTRVYEDEVAELVTRRTTARTRRAS